MSRMGGGSPWTSRIARYPAAPVAGALMLGIFLYDTLPPWPGIWLGIVGMLMGLAAPAIRREALSSALIALALFGMGLASSQIDGFRYPAAHIGAFAGDEPKLAQLELRLDHPPRDLTAPYSKGHAISPRQVATATVLRVKTWNGWVESCGQVLVQINQPNPRLKQGQRVRVIGRLERPGPAANPGQFDWAGYYREQRILGSVRVDSADGITLLDQQMTGPFAWLRAQTRRALARGFEGGDSLEHALLRALLLGDNDPELRDVQEQFRRTGTSHHLAISGMHVAILGAVVFVVCRILQIGPRRACWIGLIAVVMYGIVALPSPPVIRSVLLCASAAIGILGRRTWDLPQLLALSVVAMLIYHPLDLYNAGFQLSFGMVLGLMLFTPLVMSWLPGNDPDVQIALSWQGPQAFDSTSQAVKHWLRAVLAASIVAWVVAMPLVAIHFEQLNPWAIPASILLGPMVFFSLIGGFAKVLLSILWPSASAAWAAIAAVPIGWMRAVVEWLATFPGSDVPLPAPPVWMVILFYLLLLLVRFAETRGGVRWIARSLALGCFILLAVLPLRQGLTSLRAHAGELKVTLLSIGAGQCAVIEPPGTDAVLVDAGSATLSDLSYKALGPFLRHQGRRNIRSIFISHANADHFSAVADIVAAYDVPQVYASSQFRRHSIDNAMAEALLRSLDQLDRPPRLINPGESFELGGGAKLQVIWPPPDATLDSNNCSMVMRLSFGGKSILFTGDTQTPAMRELMKSPDLLKADVLVAPHHGSRENTTAEFIDTVSPQVIVCSNDRMLSMKQREFDRDTAGRTVYRTHTSGAITVRLSPDGVVEVDTFLRPTSLP